MTSQQDIINWKQQIGEEKLLKMIMHLITLGVKWEYVSFDFKKAKEYYLQLHLSKLPQDTFFASTQCWDIPEHLKLKNQTVKIGTVRNIHFVKNKPVRFKIGHKYPKSFYLKDFFIVIRPILTKEQDIYGLLYSNLAVNLEHYDKTKR